MSCMDLTKISFILLLIGLFFLLLLLINIEPEKIKSYRELKLDNYVSTSGKIVSIRNYGDFHIIKLDNNITLTCDGCNFQKSQIINAEGRVTEYEKELQIQAEIIEIKS